VFRREPNSKKNYIRLFKCVFSQKCVNARRCDCRRLNCFRSETTSVTYLRACTTFRSLRVAVSIRRHRLKRARDAGRRTKGIKNKMMYRSLRSGPVDKSPEASSSTYGARTHAHARYFDLISSLLLLLLLLLCYYPLTAATDSIPRATTAAAAPFLQQTYITPK